MSQGKRISQLIPLTSASLETQIVGIDRGTTYKMGLSVVSDAVRDSINTLDAQRLSSLEAQTGSYITSLNGTISSSAQISAYGFISSSQSINTGSFVTTSSFESFSSSVNTQIAAATNEQSLSHLVTTSSFNSYTASISTASLVDRLNTLESNTGSYETTGRGILSGSILDLLPNGVVSGSSQVLNGSGLWSSSVQLPIGVVSGSSQILDGSSVYSSSAQISGFETTGRGILSGSISYTDLTNIPNGIVSGSNQLTASLNELYVLSGSVQNVVLPADLISSSTQIEALGFITGVVDIDNYATTQSFNSFTQSYQSDSASFDSRIYGLSIAGVPVGTVSGSSQLTASYDERYTLSGSVQPLPADLISSSAQITAYGFLSTSVDISSLNTFTSSYTNDSSSFNDRIIDLINNTSSYETIGRGIISESVVTISDTQPTTGVGNLWYDSTVGNLYIHYDTNTWVDTSNGVIQTIISDGSLLSTASFNQYTASISTASLVDRLTAIENSTSSYETTGRGIISSSTQLTSLGYVTSGGNVTFNSVTANQYVVSSSVYYVTQSYSSGSTIFGNTIDDAHQFTGSVYISGGLSINPSASLGVNLWQLSDVNDTASGSIPNGYQLAWNTSANVWEPTAGAAAKGNIRIFVAENASNANAFYFNAVQVTALSSASPGRDTAFMLTSNLLTTIKLYLRSDQNNSNSVRVDVYKNSSGQPFASATTSIANATNTLTQYNVLTYTFSGLTLNQFDSLHIKVTPTLNPGNLYGIITIE